MRGQDAGVPRIDLESVRATLEYLHGDVEAEPALQRFAAALRSALAEIDRARLDAPVSRFDRLVALPEGRVPR